MRDFIIIGAGLSGLALAKSITEKKLGQVLILEKSRGVGGRMATRRTLGTRFDHGAQFYRLKEDSQNFHEYWLQQEVTHEWFRSTLGHHWCGNEGMTSLAKVMSAHCEVQLEKQIQTIEKINDGFRLTSDEGEIWECQNLVLTAPLTQALLLLDRSNIQYNSEFKNISYTKALIGLLTLKKEISLNEFGYLEFTSGDFFSITDQKKKGVSQKAALTVTMSPQFSEKYFSETDDSLVLQHITKIFQEKYPHYEIEGAELKKWRYCQALSQAGSLYAEVQQNFYLIGDAFGGSSLLGALRSAKALSTYLER